MENYSPLGGGLFIVPLILLLASVWGFIYLYFQRKSGSYYNDSMGKKIPSDKKPPVLQCWGFWVGAVCGASCIISLIIMYADK